MSLNYLADGKEVKEFYGNETISLVFKRKEPKTDPKVSFADMNLILHNAAIIVIIVTNLGPVVRSRFSLNGG
jgi:hypothetical protein